MATTFKTLTNNDITTTRTLLHEAIPITGTIISGTYADGNIKNYSHRFISYINLNDKNFLHEDDIVFINETSKILENEKLEIIDINFIIYFLNLNNLLLN